MNETPQNPSEPRRIDELLSPAVHPVTGELADPEREEDNARRTLDREVEAAAEAVDESREADVQHDLPPEGRAVRADDGHAYIDARREQIQRDSTSSPE